MKKLTITFLASLLFNISSAFADDAIKLQNAAFLGNMEEIRTYLDSGVAVDTVSEFASGTALYAAVNNGQEKVVELLLNKGADPDSEHNVIPVILKAAEKGYVNIVSQLIKYNADLSARDSYQRNAITWAVLGARKNHKESYVEIVSLLGSAGGECLSEFDSPLNSKKVSISKYLPKTSERFQVRYESVCSE